MKEVPFSTVLEALKSTDRPFPERYLTRFNNLSTSDLAAFVKVWPQVPVDRQRALLKNMNEMYDDDMMASFEPVGAQLIHDKDEFVRQLALRLMSETDDVRMIPELIKIMRQDPEPEVRAQAARNLGAFVQLGEMDELAPQKKQQVEDSLLPMVQDENSTVARSALEALGFSSRPEMEGLITTAFNRADPLWKATALFAAGRSADMRWQEIIITGLLSEDELVRLNAVRSAGELSLKVARKPLIEMLEDEDDDDVFQAIIWSLSQIGGEDVRTYLETLLADAEDDEQIEYLEDALANLTFTEDMENFDMLAFDPDEELDENEENDEDED